MVVGWLGRRLLGERTLRMVWRVAREDRHSYLVGSSHFFPHHFKRDLERYVAWSDAVLIEGPLDETAAGMVARRGAAVAPGDSLADRLDAKTKRRIARDVAPVGSSRSGYARSLGLGADERLDWEQLRVLTPWMAFFKIWSRHLDRAGWTHSMELDVLSVAQALGKPVHRLETIEEQLDALDAVPVERFVRFLQQPGWHRSRAAHRRAYLAGNLSGLLAAAREYPTCCDAIIAKRDPVLYERMRPFLKAGRAVAFVGTTHVPGIQRMLAEDGYTVTQVEYPRREAEQSREGRPT